MKQAFLVTTDGKVSRLTLSDDDDLGDLQKAVGGYIEAINPSDESWTGWVNEEGKLESLPINQLATHIAAVGGWPNYMVDVLVGDVVFTGGANEEGETLGLDSGPMFEYLLQFASELSA